MADREAALRAAVDRNPADAAAHGELAAHCFAEGRLDEAVREYTRVCELAPGIAEGPYNLAAALNATGDHEAALEVIEQAAERFTESALIHYGKACILQSLGRLDHALASLATSLELDADNAEAWYGVGVILLRQGDPLRASSYFDRALDVAPDHPGSLYMRDALSGHARSRPDEAFVRELFDSYAPSYDEHMLESLNYRAPALLGRVLEVCRPDAGGLQALDLGCGTGLLGSRLRPCAGELVGVDLAPGMLDRAQALGCYDRLVCADVLEYLLAQKSATQDLVAAADLFIYFAELDEVFAAVRKVLTPDGLFAFTVEENEDEDWSVGPSGRFRHSKGYLEALSARLGFTHEFFERTVLRHEGGEPCTGFVVAWSART